jgi:hypothetical protein
MPLPVFDIIPNATPAQILEQARNAAQAASDASEKKQIHWFPCGFASTLIRPARGKFITYLKSIDVGGKSYRGGWDISSYQYSDQSQQWCQSMNVKEDASRAFSQVLNLYGINASVQSRMD